MLTHIRLTNGKDPSPAENLVNDVLSRKVRMNEPKILIREKSETLAKCVAKVFALLRMVRSEWCASTV